LQEKTNYLGFLKFYQPEATGGGFLIFEWTLNMHFTNIFFILWNKLQFKKATNIRGIAVR
jgi:hypothetical protein